MSVADEKIVDLTTRLQARAFAQKLALQGGPPHGPDMEARVAVLEQIAKDTRELLVGIKSEMKELRDDMRAIRNDQRSDFRWLLGIVLGMGGSLLAVMAHGFKWL